MIQGLVPSAVSGSVGCVRLYYLWVRRYCCSLPFDSENALCAFTTILSVQLTWKTCIYINPIGQVKFSTVSGIRCLHTRRHAGISTTMPLVNLTETSEN